MRSSLFGVLFAVALSAFWAEPAQAAEPQRSQNLLEQQERVAGVTVTLTELSCAGSVAGAADQVLTAAHCIPDAASEVDVKLDGGRVLSAAVVHLDRDRDLALLRLPWRLPVEPLVLSDELPKPGDQLLFVGRVDRKSRPQVAQVARLGRCPTLPTLNDALFTSVKARPGDSGAPLVDQSLRVVGVIHGGARCHIAAPTATLAKLSVPDNRAPATPSPPSAVPLTGKIGPFAWERTQDGFRVRFQFSWTWQSR